MLTFLKFLISWCSWITGLIWQQCSEDRLSGLMEFNHVSEIDVWNKVGAHKDEIALKWQLQLRLIYVFVVFLKIKWNYEALAVILFEKCLRTSAVPQSSWSWTPGETTSISNPGRSGKDPSLRDSLIWSEFSSLAINKTSEKNKNYKISPKKTTNCYYCLKIEQ